MVSVKVVKHGKGLYSVVASRSGKIFSSKRATNKKQALKMAKAVLSKHT